MNAPPPGGQGGTHSAPGNTGSSVPPGAGGGPVLHQTPPDPEAQRLDASAAAGAAELLTPLVAPHVPSGAKPVGNLVAGQFAQGQSLTEPVTMQPGGCYTVLAVALAPVSELDLALTPAVAVGGFNPTAASDPETGTVATLGKQPNCYKWALPTQGTMNLVMTVRAGQGVAAAQVYEKL